MSRAIALGQAAAASVVTLGCVGGCAGGMQADRPDRPAGVSISRQADARTFHGVEPAQPYGMPDITLTDTSGHAFNLLRDTTKPVTLVFFGYSHCPDACPLVLQDIASAVRRVPEAVRAGTQVLFITTDPARDKPAVLRRFLDRFDPAFVGLTGPMPRVFAAAHAMGVAITGKDRLPGGGYEVGHGAQVIGFQGHRAPVIWTRGTPVPDMASDIARLAGS